MKKDKWFHPRRESGWRKSQSAQTRRRRLYGATDIKLSQYERNIQAGRMIQALGNVASDKPTRDKAKMDAKYFFDVAKSLKAKGKRKVHKRKRVKGWA